MILLTQNNLSNKYLKKLEKIIPPLVLLISIPIAYWSENQLSIILAICCYFFFNFLISKIRYHFESEKQDFIEGIRFFLNIPLLVWILNFSNQKFPPLFLIIPGLIWAPLAIRNRHLYLSVLVVYSLLISAYLYYTKSSFQIIVIHGFLFFFLTALFIILRLIIQAHTREIFLSIFKNMAAIVILCDKDGKVQYINHTFSGETSLNILGKSIIDLTPTAKRQEINDYLNKVKIEKKILIYESDLSTVLQKDYYALVQIAPLFEEGEEISGFNIVVSDITREKNNENQLVIAKNHAEDLVNSQRDFLLLVNHEIRTPLHSITSALNLIKEKNNVLNTEIQEYWHIIDVACEDLNDQISVLLNFSQLQQGEQSYNPVKFDLYQVIDNILYTQKTMTKTGVQLAVKIAKDIPRHFHGDKAALALILRNLIGNAVKYTDKGFVEITVSWAEKNRNILLIEVVDSGIGISSEKIDLIFEPFIRANNTRQGYGLGLAIAKRAAEIIKGKFKVESEPGVGTKFSIVFPMLPCGYWLAQGATSSQCDRCESLPKSMQPSISTDTIQIQKKILIVEDDPVNGMLLERILHKVGYISIKIATTGAEAQAAIAEENYDIILLDMHLPDTTGLELALNIQGICNSKIIATTADMTEEVRQKANKIGITSFVAKPIQINQLKTELELHVA